MMITRQGLEGGAVYALSAALRDAIEEKGGAVLSVDVRPSLTLDEIIKRLEMPRGSQSTSTFLRKAVGLSPVAIGLMREGFGGALPVDMGSLARLIKNTQIRLQATTPIAQAISSAGGVARDALDARLMIKQKPGVFVCGEMLDWEAPTGGYLLQACFSSAVTAAQGVEEFLG
jgi:predicted flavoprotein YhiN